MTDILIALYLTVNVLREAPNDPPESQNAIAHVVLNRARQCSGDISPESVLTELRRNAQFSWTNRVKGKRDTSYSLDILQQNSFQKFAYTYPIMIQAYSEAKSDFDPTGGALYYHLKNMPVYPDWAAFKVALPYNFQGSHIFYLGNGGNPDFEFCSKKIIPANKKAVEACQNLSVHPNGEHTDKDKLKKQKEATPKETKLSFLLEVVRKLTVRHTSK